MALVLDEDESFSMNVFVTNPGYQRVALSGYLTKQIGSETYIHSLLPEMFYGASGAQLVGSWRQYLSTSGSQTLLSRSGGLPKPTTQLFWQKLRSKAELTAAPVTMQVEPSTLLPLVVLGVVGLALLVWAVRS